MKAIIVGELTGSRLSSILFPGSFLNNSAAFDSGPFLQASINALFECRSIGLDERGRDFDIILKGETKIDKQKLSSKLIRLSFGLTDTDNLRPSVVYVSTVF
jgi:hypothetical protein